MDNIFILNPQATTSDIQEAIRQRLTQLKSIINCLLIINPELGGEPCFGMAWSMDSLLNELELLYEKVLH